MRYLKITTENAGALLVEGAILAHCKEIFHENELDEITPDITVVIINRIDSEGVKIINPDGTDSSRYELDYFTKGNWWIEDFTKEKEYNNDGSESIFLLCGMIILPLGIYMVVNKTKISGYIPSGRYGGPNTPGSASATYVLSFGIILLVVYFGLVRKNRKKINK